MPMLSRPTISAIARMLRGMLWEAIGITDVALADGGGRKEQLEPELPLFRPLKERGA